MVIFLTHSSCLCISYIFIASMQTNVQRRYIQVSDFQNYVSAEIYIPRGDGVTQVLVIQNNHTGVIAKLFSFLGQELLFCLMGDTFSISSSKCITFGSQGIIFYIVVILFTLTLILILQEKISHDIFIFGFQYLLHRHVLYPFHSVCLFIVAVSKSVGHMPSR